MSLSEEFDGECLLKGPPLVSSRRAVLIRDGNIVDVSFVLGHRYIGKRVRVTIEVIDAAAPTSGEPLPAKEPVCTCPIVADFHVPGCPLWHCCELLPAKETR